MLRYVLILILVLFTACQKNVPLEKPDWYLNLNNNETGMLIGYGYGKTMQIAKANARDDISKRLHVHIISSFSIDINTHTDRYKENIGSSLNEISIADLYDVKVLKQSIKNNNFFVALGYNSKPIIEQIVNFIDISKVVKMDENNPYYHTSFSQELYRVYGYVPNYTLIYHDGLYKLVLMQKYFSIKNEDINKFYFEKTGQDIKIDMDKVVKPGHLYTINIQLEKSGFIHLFQILDDGRVLHLINNEYKTKGKVYYPDPNKFSGLEAEILSDKTQENESYIAVLCKKSTPINMFEMITDEFSTNKNAYRFTQLYPMLQGCSYSSSVVKLIK